jgi:N12 class adenine-specific DNA methylase
MTKFNESLAFENNLNAIKLIRYLEENNINELTEYNIEVLTKYSGWGGLSSVFPNMDGEFKNKLCLDRNKRVKESLSEDEYIKAAASINDAFYTPENIVNTMWNAVERLGLRGGIALEPSCGTGRFIYQNNNSNNYNFIGFENDPITAKIAKYIVGEKAHIIHAGFEEISIPKGFDLVIGNPPYGNISLKLKDYNYSYSIHNQFILQSLNLLNNDGLACFVISHHVMDNQNSSARYEMSKLADLIGAIRLPSTAFGESNTQVITDILLFKRHSTSKEYSINQSIENLTYQEPFWVKGLTSVLSEADQEAEGAKSSVLINSYFATQGKIAGKLGTKISRFGFEVDILDDGKLDEHLSSWVKSLNEEEAKPFDKLKSTALYQSMVAHLYIGLSGKEVGVLDRDEKGELYRIIEQDSEYGALYKTEYLSADSVWSEKYRLDYVNGYYEKIPKLDELGNKLYKFENGIPTSLIDYEHKYVDLQDINPRSKLGENRLNKLEQLVDIRDLLLEQIKRESEEYADQKIEENRSLLKAAYDKFVKKHGYINNSSNTTLITDLPDAGLLLSLEFDYKNAVKVANGFTESGKQRYITTKPESAKQSAILNKRVIYKTCIPTKAENLDHALSLSMTQKGKVDLDYMAQLCDTDHQTVTNDLYAKTENPSIFFDHELNRWIHKALYLSGNVRKKLKHAIAADDEIAIKALNAVIPERVSIENIGVNIGAKWIPEQIYLDFVKFITEDDKATLSYHEVANCYDLECSASVAKESIYGTEKVSLKRLLDSLLNSITIRVTKTVVDYKGNEKSVFDAEATELAIVNADNLKIEFTDWLFNQIDHLEELENIYNDKFNSFVVPKFDGSELVILGKVPDSIIKLRQHQLDLIYRGIVSNVLLGDHCVGAGKTFEIIALAMMRKKMGLSTKPMVVVPNHLIEQFAADVYRLFPAAKILAAGAKDFEKKKRRKILARIATGEFDLIIIPHSSFEFIKLSDEIQHKFINEEVEKIERAILLQGEVKSGSRSAKTLQQNLKRLKSRLESSINEKRNDKILSFDQLGVTHLAVDEADLFKNVPFSTNMRNVVGLGNPLGSNRAMDLYLKVKWLKSIDGSVNYFTGTSISNSGAEMYLLMRSLIGDQLEELGLGHFDNWANFFAENGTKFEASESGKLKQVTRFAREWRNMRTLMNLWYLFTDAITSDDIKRVHQEQTGKKFPIADLIGGQRQSIVVEPNEYQRLLLDEVLERYDTLDQITDTKERNAERLRLMDIAKKLSLAARCVNPIRFSAETGGKVEVMADNIFKIYQEWDKHKGTQLVFFDRSVPRKKSDSKVLKIYDGLKAKLDEAIEKGDERSIQIYEDKLDQYSESEIESMRFAQSSTWNIYQELKDLLVERGMNPEQVRFIQEANNDKQKKELFDLVKTGEVRVLIGSTHLMGAGTNVQNRLVHLHHGDVTWRPRDLEQREGRILRQGSDLLEEIGQDKFKVGITCYVTKYSMDAKLYEVNGAKLKMISAIRNYSGEHSFDFGEDADTVTLQEIAAIATGNPLMLERVTLDVEIKRLERLYSSHLRKQSSIALQVKRLESDIEHLPVKYEMLKQATNIVKTSYLAAKAINDEKCILINGEAFKDADDALNRIDALKKAKEVIKIDDVIMRHSEAKLKIKSYLDNDVFCMEIGDQTVYSCLKAAEYVYVKIKKANLQSIHIGNLFGLPVYVEGDNFSGLNYMVLSKDENSVVAEYQSRYLMTKLNVMQISSNLISLMKSLFKVLKDKDTLIKKVEDAKRNVDQLRPVLNTEFKQAPELSLKRKRLELAIKALQSDDCDNVMQELLEEHKDELAALQSKIDLLNPIVKPNSEDMESIATMTKKVKQKVMTCNVVVNGKVVKAEQMALF